MKLKSAVGGKESCVNRAFSSYQGQASRLRFLVTFGRPKVIRLYAVN
jgi:hypothetical protein